MGQTGAQEFEVPCIPFLLISGSLKGSYLCTGVPFSLVEGSLKRGYLPQTNKERGLTNRYDLLL